MPLVPHSSTTPILGKRLCAALLLSSALNTAGIVAIINSDGALVFASNSAAIINNDGGHVLFRGNGTAKGVNSTWIGLILCL